MPELTDRCCSGIFTSGGEKGRGLWSGWGLSPAVRQSLLPATIAGMASRRASFDEEQRARLAFNRAQRAQANLDRIARDQVKETELDATIEGERQVIAILERLPQSRTRDGEIHDANARLEDWLGMREVLIARRASDVSFYRDVDARAERADVALWHTALMDHGSAFPLTGSPSLTSG